MTGTTPSGSLTVRVDGRVLTLAPGTALRVGREGGSDLAIPHPDVSRRHVVIYDADGWCVADEGSLNGTFVAGERVEAIRVDVVTRIHLGGAESPAMIDLEPSASVPALEPVSISRPADEDSLHRTVMSGRGPQPFRGAAVPAPLDASADAIRIGKAPDNDVVLDDIHVSRYHARAIPSEKGFLVEDLNSLNGTFLNAVPVQRAFMSDGDRLTIGNTDFVRMGTTLVAQRSTDSDAGGLDVAGLEFRLRSGKSLIKGVDLRAARGSLTAVIGPSGAGKSTLSRLLAGVAAPSAGRVEFDGFDLQRDYQAVKTRVGLVPQDDVVHRQLRLSTALRYASDLRLPGSVGRDAKARQVARVSDQLGLKEHARTRIERLSGGQRKRASVAMELLTEPSLLILDEPTSGLDPALDRQVMRTLRELADGDRTVIVVTHSVAYLDLCDQVLVLAPGGMPAYLGPTSGIVAHFGTDDWGDIFGALAEDPQGSHERWASAGGAPARGRVDTMAPAKQSVGHGSSWTRQALTLVARQVNLMVSDRGYILFLLALPFVIGLLPAVVPGSAGLTEVPGDEPAHAGEPTFVLSLLIIGATFMGISMSIRDLVGERAIFLRERAVGLFPSAYLASKTLVFGLFSALSAAIMVLVASLVKTPPDAGVMGIWPPLFELFVPLFMTTWVAAALGLMISAFVASSDQVMPVLIVVLMVQLVLHGGLIPILDNDLLNTVSKAIPGRWGFAAAASGIDLEALVAPGQIAGAEPDADPLWEARKLRWSANMGVLTVFGAAFSALTWWRLRSGRR